MQVTLKKAAELSRAALAAAKAIEIKPSISISAYSTEEVETLLESGLASFRSALERANILVEAGYAIRDIIAVANHDTGVDNLLTRVAAIDERIARVTAAMGGSAEAIIYGVVDSSDLSAVKRRIEQSRKDVLDAEVRRYGQADTIAVSVLNDAARAEINDQIGALKRKRTALKDELTALNFSTKVKLPDIVVTALRGEKLID